MTIPASPSTLVLLSGGVDSAVLLAHEAAIAPVAAVYVSSGLAWEPLELAMVDRLLAHSTLAGRVTPLARVTFPMRDIYPASHWAIRGTPPAYDSPDDEVYLVGRNLGLLSKAGVVAARLGADRLVLGPLAGNRFPDARPAFFAAMATALSLGLDRSLAIAAPFLEWDKPAVIRRGRALGVPFDLTLSCMSPLPAAMAGEGPRHCGQCSKCRERRDAFAAAGLADPATYAAASPR
jgi:7-cyano-7-deazaguanine synthase